MPEDAFSYTPYYVYTQESPACSIVYVWHHAGTDGYGGQHNLWPVKLRLYPKDHHSMPTFPPLQSHKTELPKSSSYVQLQNGAAV